MTAMELFENRMKRSIEQRRRYDHLEEKAEQEFRASLEIMAEKICSDYCKFPSIYSDTFEMRCQRCAMCPLNEII